MKSAPAAIDSWPRYVGPPAPEFYCGEECLQKGIGVWQHRIEVPAGRVPPFSYCPVCLESVRNRLGLGGEPEPADLVAYRRARRRGWARPGPAFTAAEWLRGMVGPRGGSPR